MKTSMDADFDPDRTAVYEEDRLAGEDADVFLS